MNKSFNNVYKADQLSTLDRTNICNKQARVGEVYDVYNHHLTGSFISTISSRDVFSDLLNQHMS